MEKLMAYRVYKKKFSDCENLGDYDKQKKTITVIIPDDDVRLKRNKRINTRIWNSYGAEWRIKKYDTRGCFLKFKVCADETGYTAWWEERNQYSGGVATHYKSGFPIRDSATDFVLEMVHNFES